MLMNILIVVITGTVGALPLFFFKYPRWGNITAGCGIAAYTGILIFLFPGHSAYIIGVICGSVGWFFNGLGHFFFKERDWVALWCSGIGLLLGGIALIMV